MLAGQLRRALAPTEGAVATAPMGVAAGRPDDAVHALALSVCSTVDLDELMARLASLTLEVVPADRCSLLLLGADGRLAPTFTTGSGSGADTAVFQHMPPIDLVGHGVRWDAFSAGQVIALPDMGASALIPRDFVERFGSKSALLAPLVVAGEAIGVLVLDWKSARCEFPNEQIEALGTIAGYAAAAVRNATLVRDARLRADAFEQMAGVTEELAAAISGSSHLAIAVQCLNRLLGPAVGCRLRAVAITDSRLREVVGGRAPNRVERAVIDLWRGAQVLQPVRRGSHVLLPMRQGRRLLGCVRVTGVASQLDPNVEAILVAAASACATFVHDARLRHEAAEQARRDAVQQERERIGRDLHDSVGQVLVGLGMRLAAYARAATDDDWKAKLDELATLASEGNSQVRDAIEALLFLDVERQGLVASLRQLVATFEASTDIEADLHVVGTTSAIRRSDSEALYRVANEALANVHRHSGATTVHLALVVTDDEVRLAVRDDGIGLVNRQVFGSAPGHFGLRGVQMLVRDAGGELQLGDVKPHGAVVEAVFNRSSAKAVDLEHEASARPHR